MPEVLHGLQNPCQAEWGAWLHPSNYFGLFPAFPRDRRVFVAMSFAPQFDARWSNVIAPAIQAVTLGGAPLEPYRVDMRQVSDSILTEILDAIATCRLLVADITTTGVLDGRAVRNANVMYEVGLAHASRLPEEVLLVRSDDDPLNFDVSNVRVLSYRPDELADDARASLSSAVLASLNEVDLRRSLAVRKVASSLDATAWSVLLGGSGGVVIQHPTGRTMGDVLGGSRQTQAIQVLLEVGALETQFVGLTAEAVAQDIAVDQAIQYRITPLGQAVVQYGLKEMNLVSPEVLAALAQLRRADGDTG